MDKIKMLSGEELLEKGVNKLEVVLPTLGLKDITPNGSWLEQKQIQSALVDRKNLVEAQRIEKRGVLSHAVWHEDLKLAEVIQHTGSHWQYFGHTRERKLHLLPEETLFLIEVNCLILTYNEIVVSLQQAYSLLLREQITLRNYKVYGFLSRLGYKVYRHDCSPVKKSEDNENTQGSNEMVKNKKNVQGCSDMDIDTIKSNMQNETENVAENEKGENNFLATESHSMSRHHEKNTASESDNNQVYNKLIQESDSMNNENSETLNNKNISGSSILSETRNNLPVNNQREEVSINVDDTPGENLDFIAQKRSKIFFNEVVNKIDECNNDNKIKNEKDPLTQFIEWKLEKLKNRPLITRPSTKIHNYFENIPDLSKNRVITINVPKGELLPKNIFLNNLSYVLNVDNVTSKNITPPNADSRTYSISDEVNGEHVKRVTSSMQNRPQNVLIPPFYQNYRQTTSYSSFQYWRPRPNLNYFQFNLFFQRPFMTNLNMPRFQFYPRTHIPMFTRYFTNTAPFNVNNRLDSQNREGTTYKRKRSNARKHHLESIKELAQRLHHLVASGHIQTENREALQRLIQTYNIRYRTKVRLTDQYQIINDETIMATIELDDDEQTKSKRRRVGDDCSLRDLHLNEIRRVAFKLKQLEIEKKASARHRRALSGLIKTYNKSYNADIYTNDNYEVLDRRSITLDSSSEPEIVVKRNPKIKSGKKLRNPFNILKRLSEKQILVTSPTTSKQECAIEDTNKSQIIQMSKNVLTSIFKKGWLPNENDFGRPEVVSRDKMNLRIIESKKEEYLYDFLKDKPVKFHDWVESKIAFLESTEESNAIFQNEVMKVDGVDIKSIIKAEDCTDMPSVLKKLSIIKQNNTTISDTELTVTYDVYNKDVQNFRKSSRPTPHFRIMCLNASSPGPSSIDIATLHSKYKDNVIIVFAIVGTASVSFIQMNPTDSPVYTACNN